VNVFNNDLLLSFAAVSVERFEECGCWSAKAERCAMIVALILTDVTISL